MIPEELYRQVRQLMPIPCVDLLVSDTRGRVLLVKRKHEPAANQWWFPGGRTHFGEVRADAAVRKLKEECGLGANSVEELGTFDVILEDAPPGVAAHGISTLFHMRVQDNGVCLDDQSLAADWRSPEDWQEVDLHPFVAQCLRLYLHVVSE